MCMSFSSNFTVRILVMNIFQIRAYALFRVSHFHRCDHDKFTMFFYIQRCLTKQMQNSHISSSVDSILNRFYYYKTHTQFNSGIIFIIL